LRFVLVRCPERVKQARELLPEWLCRVEVLDDLVDAGTERCGRGSARRLRDFEEVREPELERVIFLLRHHNHLSGTKKAS
jgi:hypothetical protein